MTDPISILEAQLRISLKRRKARAALAATGYNSGQQSARGFAADLACVLRAYVDMNEVPDMGVITRACLMAEAVVEVLDEQAR